MMWLLHWSFWQQNHDLLPTGIKVTNYPSCTQDRHSLEELTLCYSVIGSLFQVCALFFLIGKECSRSSSVFTFSNQVARCTMLAFSVMQSKLRGPQTQPKEAHFYGPVKWSVPRAWWKPEYVHFLLLLIKFTESERGHLPSATVYGRNRRAEPSHAVCFPCG